MAANDVTSPHLPLCGLDTACRLPCLISIFSSVQKCVRFVLFRLIKKRSLISCVFWIFFQNAGSQLCFRFFFPALWSGHCLPAAVPALYLQLCGLGTACRLPCLLCIFSSVVWTLPAGYRACRPLSSEDIIPAALFRLLCYSWRTFRLNLY